jgi:YVTN family beta-propeller protein
VTPDGTQALVTSFDGAVNFIDLTTLKRTATLATPNDNPSGIAISNDGSTAYVTSFTNSGALLTIDIAGRKVTNRLPLQGYPQSVVLSPDDSLAWVIFPFTDTITVVDTLTGTVAKNLQISSPYGVAFNAAGTRAYVSNRSQGTVQVIDTATYQTVKSIPVGNGPVEILVSPDDTYAVVSNFDGASLTAFDLNSYATTTLKLPDQPLGMAFVQ